ncbi:MAG: type II toxin-antitoxin system PemK/MazF family toxin [Candidatus Moeniiplasma glomeromycotorum]|nr:type II toxin-antitoxin system PemK/MazF family toxin [Candidatus Moeniiplasma glomeromycotorum]
MSKKLLFPKGFLQQGEIYLVDFNRKQEKEIFKIRPALVASSDLQNEYDKQILVALISAEVELTEEEIKLLSVLSIIVSPTKETGLKRESRILLHRVRAVSKGKPRILEYLGAVNPKVLKQVKETLKIVFDWE